MNFSEKLQLLRKSKGMSQEDLAVNLNVSRQSVSKWELGDSIPDVSKILLIGKVFNVTMDYLLDDTFSDTIINSQSNNEHIPSADHHNNNYANNNKSIFESSSKVIKKRGYIVGYIISILSGFFFILSRLAHFAFKKTLQSQEKLSSLFDSSPTSFPLNIINVISIILFLICICGLVLAMYLKRKSVK